MTEKDKKTQEKPQSDKFGQIQKRKKLLTAEIKKVVGGKKPFEPENHNEIFVSI